MNIPALILVAAWAPEILHPVKDAATHQMLQAIAGEPDRVVRAEALEAFALIKDPADAPWVRPRFDDPIAAVRLEARAAGSALGLPLPAGPVPQLLPAPVIAPAAAALEATVEHLRQVTPTAAAAGAVTDEILAKIGAPEIVVQEEAVRAAQRAGIVAAIPRLLPLLNDEDEALRQTTCAALAVLGPKGDHQPVIAALAARLAGDESSLVRQAAGTALVAIHDAPAELALQHALAHPRPGVRLAAATALGDWRSPAVAAVLYPLFEDPEPSVAIATIAALGKLGETTAPAHFLQRLPRGPVLVQEPLVWWLGEWRVAAAVTPLLDLLQPKPPAADLVRRGETGLIAKIAEALGKIGDQRAVPVLRWILADNRAAMAEPRLQALTALHRLRDRDSMKRVFELLTEQVIIPPLPAPLSYDTTEVRAAGLRYVASFGDAALGERLFTGFKDTLPVEIRPLLADTLHTLTGKFYRPIPNEAHRQYCVESLGPPSYHGVPEKPGVALIEKPAGP